MHSKLETIAGLGPLLGIAREHPSGSRWSVNEKICGKTSLPTSEGRGKEIADRV